MFSGLCKTGVKTVRAEPVAKPCEGLRTVYNTGNDFECRFQ